MLFSLALIFILGFILSGLFQKANLPGLLGMMITGIVLGPFVLDLISPDVLAISDQLRKIALIIILVRAGLSLDIQDLKMVGRPAFLLSFLPASLEIGAFTLIGPILFEMTHLEAALLGSVIAAVSPAVIVPRMLGLLEEKRGTKKKIPQLIMASASVDDIFVIILFTSFMTMMEGTSSSMPVYFHLPLALTMGLGLGILSGLLLNFIYKTFNMRQTTQVLVLLSVAFFLTSLEAHITLASLLSVMVMAMTLLRVNPSKATELKTKFANLWVGAELILFVLVGAAVPLAPVKTIGLMGIILILLTLAFRLAGVLVSLVKTPLNKQERAFCLFAYMPKATVQAALAPLPLAAGLTIGQDILTLGVLSIFITAPLGAIAIDRLKTIWLEKE